MRERSFYGWTGDASGTNNPLVVVISTNKIVQADFVALPTVNVSPENLVVFAGSNAVFNANAAGFPPLSYQWQKNGTALANSGNISGATSSTLSITGVSDSDAGIYSVTVTNLAGSVTSSNVTLTVNDLPFITSQPQSQTALAGATATFNVTVYGEPPFVFQWYFNGTPLGLPATGTNVWSCTLTDVGTNQAGNYSVEIVNGYGSLMNSKCVADGACSADAGFAIVGRVSGVESGWYAGQQLRGAVQHQSGGHQLDESAFPDQFADQPVSIP